MIIFLGDKKLGDNGVGDNGLGDSWLGDNGNRPKNQVYLIFGILLKIGDFQLPPKSDSFFVQFMFNCIGLQMN